ncbi:hypothetical protein GW17_00045230 [Ensete ventricosum]|nr:hypothetical protein GW17_00045230 [Ensete ventricosum]
MTSCSSGCGNAALWTLIKGIEQALRGDLYDLLELSREWATARVLRPRLPVAMQWVCQQLYSAARWRPAHCGFAEEAEGPLFLLHCRGREEEDGLLTWKQQQWLGSMRKWSAMNQIPCRCWWGRRVPRRTPAAYFVGDVHEFNSCNVRRRTSCLLRRRAIAGGVEGAYTMETGRVNRLATSATTGRQRSKGSSQ